MSMILGIFFSPLENLTYGANPSFIAISVRFLPSTIEDLNLDNLPGVYFLCALKQDHQQPNLKHHPLKFQSFIT